MFLLCVRLNSEKGTAEVWREILELKEEQRKPIPRPFSGGIIFQVVGFWFLVVFCLGCWEGIIFIGFWFVPPFSFGGFCFSWLLRWVVSWFSDCGLFRSMVVMVFCFWRQVRW